MRERLKSETIKQWLKRVSILDKDWIKKAKARTKTNEFKNQNK
jgi:hypothetical protein